MDNLTKNHAMSLGLNSNPTGKGPFTIECWVEPDANLDKISILKKEGVFDFYIEEKRLWLSLSDKFKMSSDINKPPISANEWHHVAITYDCSFVRLYLHGRVIGCRAASLTIEDNENEWQTFPGIDEKRYRYFEVYEFAREGRDLQD